MHLDCALTVLAQGPSHQCDAAGDGGGIKNERFVILRKDILNPLFGVHWPDNLDERLPKAFIDAVVPALIGYRKSRLVYRSCHPKAVEDLFVLARHKQMSLNESQGINCPKSMYFSWFLYS